ncbi:MAG: TfoX/Sxy family protein [Panacibacter sp.]
MAYNEKLADRTREIVAQTHANVEDKKMFGGLCFMVNAKMCVGVQSETLMVRIDPEKYEAFIDKGFEPMDHNGRIMKGFGFINQDKLNTKKQLEYWVKLALEYNKIAPVSKKKKK